MDLAKQVMRKSSGTTPRLVRLDVLGDMRVCEYQVPGAAWGPVSALEAFYGTSDNTMSLIDTFRRRLEGRRGFWWIHKDDDRSSMTFLVKHLRKHGVDVCDRGPDFDPHDASLNVLLKRKHFLPMLSEETGRVLIRRWLDGQIEIDPPPHIVEDTKLAFAMMWHPDTRAHFTDEERRAAVPSFLIEDLDQLVELPLADRDASVVQFRVRDLLADKLPPGASKAIIKYAGNRPGDMQGGHAVFALNHLRGKLRKQLIEQVLTEFREGGHPWIIQPFSAPKRTLAEVQQPPIDQVLPFWRDEQVSESQVRMFAGEGARNDQYYPLLRPTYRVDDAGEVHLGPCGLLVRRTWKVHGTSDTAQGLCIAAA